MDKMIIAVGLSQIYVDPFAERMGFIQWIYTSMGFIQWICQAFIEALNPDRLCWNYLIIYIDFMKSIISR